MVLQGTWSDPLAGDLLAAGEPTVPFGMSPVAWKKLLAGRLRTLAKQAAAAGASKGEIDAIGDPFQSGRMSYGTASAKMKALIKKYKKAKKAGRRTGAAGIFARYKLPILIGGGLLAFFMLRRRKAVAA